MEDLINKAKEILIKVPFLIIATVNIDGSPHCSPVFCAYDESYNFFWNSQMNSGHSNNIKNNQDVFCVIFDSSVKEGDGKGVYMKGKAFEIDKKEEAKYALEVFYKKKGKELKSEELYTGDSKRRFYKFVPEKFWINTFEKVNDLPNDGKIQIDLFTK